MADRTAPGPGGCIYEGGPHHALCTIQSFLTTDLFVGYNALKSLQLSLTIKNLDNRQPPVDANLSPYLSLGNSAFHDPMGRYFVAGAKYAFW